MFVNSISSYNSKSNNYNKTNTQPSFQHLTLSKRSTFDMVCKFLKFDANSPEMVNFKDIIEKFKLNPINLKQHLRVEELQEKVMKEHDLVYLNDTEINTCCADVLSEFLKQIGEKQAEDYAISVALRGNFFAMFREYRNNNVYRGLRIVNPDKVTSIKRINVKEKDYDPMLDNVQNDLRMKCINVKNSMDYLAVPTEPSELNNNVVDVIYNDLKEAASSILELKNSKQKKAGATMVRQPRKNLELKPDGGPHYIPGISPEW